MWVRRKIFHLNFLHSVNSIKCRVSRRSCINLDTFSESLFNYYLIIRIKLCQLTVLIFLHLIMSSLLTCIWMYQRGHRPEVFILQHQLTLSITFGWCVSSLANKFLLTTLCQIKDMNICWQSPAANYPPVETCVHCWSTSVLLRCKYMNYMRIETYSMQFFSI